MRLEQGRKKDEESQLTKKHSLLFPERSNREKNRILPPFRSTASLHICNEQEPGGSSAPKVFFFRMSKDAAISLNRVK